jgi:hypothetical protein
MNTEKAIELFAAIHFFVIGLSHIFQPRAWADFFIRLRERGHAGVFVNGFLSLGFGSIIVAFHNVWEGLPMVLTIMGWAQVLKGLLCFTVPQLNMRGLQRVRVERAWEFAVAGTIFLPLGGLMVYLVATR